MPLLDRASTASTEGPLEWSASGASGKVRDEFAVEADDLERKLRRLLYEGEYERSLSQYIAPEEHYTIDVATLDIDNSDTAHEHTKYHALTLRVSSFDKVRNLKERIKERAEDVRKKDPDRTAIEIAPTALRLMKVVSTDAAGKIVYKELSNDDATLEFYKLKDQDTLHLVKSVLFVRTRMNCNMKSKILDELFRERKKQVEELADVVRKDFENQGKDADMFKREEDRKHITDEVQEKQHDLYNDNTELTNTMKKVLDLLPKLGDEIGYPLRHESFKYDGQRRFTAARVSGIVATYGADPETVKKGRFATCSWDPDLQKAQESGDHHFAAIREWTLPDGYSTMYEAPKKEVVLCAKDNRWQQPLCLTWIPKNNILAAGLFDGTIVYFDPNSDGPVQYIGHNRKQDTEEEFLDLVLQRMEISQAETQEPITAVAAAPNNDNDHTLLVAGTMNGTLRLYVYNGKPHEFSLQLGGWSLVREISRCLNEDDPLALRHSESANHQARESTHQGVGRTDNPLWPFFGHEHVHSHSSAEEAHSDVVCSLVWLSDRKFVSASLDKRIFVWEVRWEVQSTDQGEHFWPSFYASGRKISLARREITDGAKTAHAAPITALIVGDKELIVRPELHASPVLFVSSSIRWLTVAGKCIGRRSTSKIVGL
eukprot:SAG31_NODE_455_length_15433_cov_4.248728_5_plen_656_part_00